MTKQITRQQLSAALVERHGQERQQHLYTASVGITGLGLSLIHISEPTRP